MRQTMRTRTYRYRVLLALPIVLTLMVLFAVSARAADSSATLWRGETWRPATFVTGKRTWTSMNPKIASVTRKGLVKGLKAGIAVIQVSNGSQTQQFPVTVRVPNMNYSSVRLKEGGTWQLSLSGLKASWSSGNKKVAVVSSDGFIRAKNPGNITITARYAGYSYTCKLTVFKDLSIRKLTLNRLALNLFSGSRFRLKLTVAPSRLQYLAKNAMWRSSNSNVVRVSGGTVTAVRPGTATVTVKLQGITMACQVSVSENPYISTASQLFAIDGKEGTYYLKNDLDLSRSTRKLKELRCTLFGNGHQITVSDDSFLIRINNGTVNNLRIKGGALVKLNNGTVRGCWATGQILLSREEQIQHGIADENRGTIQKCVNRRTISVVNNSLRDNAMNLAGIAMVNRGTIRECSNEASLSTAQKAAGMAVWNYGNIINCLNDHTIDGSNGCGISYFNSGTLSNCLNVGKADYAFSTPGRAGERLDCYYLKGRTKDREPDADTPSTRIRQVTSGTIKNPASFPTFDFGGVWIMRKDGPDLR